jgi:hypothetical protein
MQKPEADCASDCISRALREHAKCRLLVVAVRSEAKMNPITAVRGRAAYALQARRARSTKRGILGYQNHPTRFYLPRTQA